MEDEKRSMKKLVRGALAYYGLELCHLFNGQEFKPCFKVLEIDRSEVLKSFGHSMESSEEESLNEFARMFCHPIVQCSIGTNSPRSSSRPMGRGDEIESGDNYRLHIGTGGLDVGSKEDCRDGSLVENYNSQQHAIPTTIKDLLPQGFKEQGEGFSRPLWKVLSTFTRDVGGRYVGPYSRVGRIADNKVNFVHRSPVQDQGRLEREKSPVETEEDLLRNLEEYTNLNRLAGGDPSCRPDVDSLKHLGSSDIRMGENSAFRNNASGNYSPTKDYSPARYPREGAQSLVPERLALANGKASIIKSTTKGKFAPKAGNVDEVAIFLQWLENPSSVVLERSDLGNRSLLTRAMEYGSCSEENLLQSGNAPVGQNLKENLSETEEVHVVTWRDELATARPDLYFEFMENYKDIAFGENRGVQNDNIKYDRRSSPLIEVKVVEVTKQQEKELSLPGHIGEPDEESMWLTPTEKKRKRTCGTDDEMVGKIVDFSSSGTGSIRRGKVKPVQSTTQSSSHGGRAESSPEASAEVPINFQGTDGEVVGSSRPSLSETDEIEGDYQSNRLQKRTKTSWPTPLYGAQAERSTTEQPPLLVQKACSVQRTKSIRESSLLLEVDRDLEDPVYEETFNNEDCEKREQIALSKYIRLFKDDHSWKQKFLDGIRLNCDICFSKGEKATFTDVMFLMLHAWNGTEFKRPEHRGYARAINNLIELDKAGNVRTCHSVHTRTCAPRTGVWPPVIVLENTLKNGGLEGLCLGGKNFEFNLPKDVRAYTRKTKLHKLTVRGELTGQSLLEFPATRRGWLDANRLHRYFDSSGRSYEEWLRIKPKYWSMISETNEEQELNGLMRMDPGNEAGFARIAYGYIALSRIIQYVDPLKKHINWKIVDVEYIFDLDERMDS